MVYLCLACTCWSSLQRNYIVVTQNILIRINDLTCLYWEVWFRLHRRLQTKIVTLLVVNIFIWCVILRLLKTRNWIKTNSNTDIDTLIFLRTVIVAENAIQRTLHVCANQSFSELFLRIFRGRFFINHRVRPALSFKNRLCEVFVDVHVQLFVLTPKLVLLSTIMNVVFNIHFNCRFNNFIYL